MMDSYFDDAVALLRRLIATPSVSREETAAADLIAAELRSYGFEPCREGNNVWAVCPDYDERRPTLLLNAHLDTVRPVSSWTRDPFAPVTEGDHLYGLGANDCGGGLVTLLQVFRRGVGGEANLIFLATAEEEVSGQGGARRVLKMLPRVDAAIVGEPTGMQPAIAERGLMVLDVTARGRSGHAARGEGVNAIYEAMADLEWLRTYRFERVSPLLGETHMQVTQIEAGTQHNVVPDTCHMVVDVRTNELYNNREVYDEVASHLSSEVKARSLDLNSSRISDDHPLVRRCVAMGLHPFGSPTLSDQSLMPWPSLKLGPGNSARSHTADEYICLSEIRQALDIYTQLLFP
ncbi:MAG: M20 family metallo-hydrolase [Prevotella sp.]|nr:M20 family metallo-hydrolase [Prevotella sp.]